MKLLQNVSEGDVVYNVDYTNLKITKDIITNIIYNDQSNIISFYTKNKHNFIGECNLEITPQNMFDVAMATSKETAELALYSWCNYKIGVYENAICKFNLKKYQNY